MWDEFLGEPLPLEDAWRLFDQWRASGKEVGLVLCGKSGTVTALGRIISVRNGQIEIRGAGAGAWVQLKSATFTSGPLPVFPGWPAGPMVEVAAIQAYLPSGEWA